MFDAKHILDLSFEHREALLRPSRSSDTFKFRTLPPPPVKSSYRQQVIDHTRQAYGVQPKPNAPEPQAPKPRASEPQAPEPVDDDIRPSRRPTPRAAAKSSARAKKVRIAKPKIAK